MKPSKLRDLLKEPGIIRAPGAFDAWSARLIEMAGFPVCYMTGYGTSASVIGQPDIGLITMSEMVTQARNMASAVTIPLIADGDTGYGGILNVIRTVQEFERAGVAGLQIEDQIFPKRCGHMEGKQLITKEEMTAKIRAAVSARKSKDFIIIARTDARAVTSLEDAIARANAYAVAGADVLFVEAPQTINEMVEIGRVLKVPLVANMVESGKTPLLTTPELERIGYKIAIYPVSARYAGTKAIIKMLRRLKEEDSTASTLTDLVGFQEFNQLIGVDKMRALEESYLGESLTIIT